MSLIEVGRSAVASGVNTISGLVTSATEGKYVVPIVHVQIPENLVTIGFWGVLAGTAALGIIDFPLAALIGAGVVITRHRAKSNT